MDVVPGRRGRVVLYGAALFWAALCVVLATKLRGQAVDDFFITYRCAGHLADGRGLVFNPGERVFGLTNPGLALLLAGMARLCPLEIPVLATAVFAAALLALVWLVSRCAARSGHLAESLAGGTLLVTSSYLWAQAGGESVPMLALLAGAAELGIARPILAGLLAGAAVWFRPEAAVGAGFLCLLLWFEERRAATRCALAAAVVVGGGILAAAWYFGTPIPNTLAAKEAMAAGHFAEATTGAHFWLRSVRLVARHWGPQWWVLVILGLVGQVSLFASGGRAIRVIVLFAVSLTVLYPLSGVPWFPWYTVPTLVAALYGMAFFAGWTVRLLGRRPGVWRRAAAACAGCLVGLPVVLSMFPASYRWQRDFHWPAYMERYRNAGYWLARNAPPQASVSYYEVGALGYFSDRTVVDLLGIVTPELVPFVRRGDLTGAFLARPADYAIADIDRGGLMPTATPWFQAAYHPVARFGGLTLFERRREVALPLSPRH